MLASGPGERTRSQMTSMGLRDKERARLWVQIPALPSPYQSGSHIILPVLLLHLPSGAGILVTDCCCQSGSHSVTLINLELEIVLPLEH